jgi:uncharacterized repeat protein (TIGR02543 family)
MRRLQFFLICLGIMLLGLVKAVNPLFQNFTSSNLTNDSADISFDLILTDPASSGDLYLDYGTTTALGSRISLGSVVSPTSKKVQYFFNNLNPLTTYYWSVTYSDTFNSTTTSSIIQSFATLQNLVVTMGGTGSGTVSSNPTGINNCFTTCYADFPAGTVILTASPNIDSIFDGWSGGGCTGTALTCSVTMEVAKTVKATFNIKPFELIVIRPGTGTGSISSKPAGINCGTTCTANFPPGTVVELTAAPEIGSVFAGWGGSACRDRQSNPTCSITINAYTTVAAQFNPPPQHLEVSQAGTGGGTGKISSSPAGINNCVATCGFDYNVNTLVTLSATPDVNSSFTGWTGACTNASGDCTVTMTAAKFVTAKFAYVPPATSTLKITKDGGGTGVVSDSNNIINCGSTCQADFYQTDTVTLTATPNTGSSFAGWTGACTNASGVCVVTMEAAKTVNATFNIGSTFALNLTKSGTGTGNIFSPSGINCGSICTADFAPGTVVELTAESDRGSVFAGWDGACAFRQSNTTCAITINADTTVSALFDALGSLEVAVNGLPSGSSAPLQVSGPNSTETPTVLTGTSQFYNNIASGIYTVTAPNVLVSGINYIPNLASQTANIFAGAGGSQVVTVSYRIQTVALDVTKSGTGTGSISSDIPGIDCGANCKANFDQGSKVTLTAKPDAGSSFTGWTGAGCSGTGDCTITMNAISSVNAEFSSKTFGALDLLVNGLPTGEKVELKIIDSNGVGTPVTVLNGTTQTLSNQTPGKYEVQAPDVVVAGTTYTPDLASQTVTIQVGITSSLKISYKPVLVPTFALTINKTGKGASTSNVSSNPAGISCGATCTASFDQGTSVTLTPAPGAGISFTGWTGDCTGTGACTVTMTAIKNVFAQFEPTPPVFDLNITIDSTGTGTGTILSNPAGIDCGTTCSSKFTQGTPVTLTAAPLAGSSFVGWRGAGCTGTGTCTVIMDADNKVTAKFNLIPKYPLTIAKNGSGSGTVSSDLAGIDCGATCTSSFLQGTSVTLTATADAGSSFAGWAGACTGTATCVVTMDAIKSVKATFDTSITPTFALTVKNVGAGSVSSNPSGINCGTVCTANFSQATSVVLTAAAASGSSFVGWSGGACTGTGTCTVTMDAIKNVTATFKTNVVPTFALTVTKSGSGSISSAPAGIDCGATCTSSFDQAKVVTLTAIPAVGSSFTGWTGACTNTSGVCVVTMDAAKTVTATFTANPPANVASSKPSNAPADRMVMKGSSDNSALAFAFTLPGGSLSSITLNVNGSGNDATDLTNVKLYKDSNANGLVDAGEPMLVSGEFLGDNGTLTLTPANVAALAASGATQFVVAVDVGNALAMTHYVPVLGGLLLMGLGLRRRRWLGMVGVVLMLSGCSPQPVAEFRTYQLSLSTVSAKDASGLPVNITGLPIAGATLSVEK